MNSDRRLHEQKPGFSSKKDVSSPRTTCRPNPDNASTPANPAIQTHVGAICRHANMCFRATRKQIPVALRRGWQQGWPFVQVFGTVVAISSLRNSRLAAYHFVADPPGWAWRRRLVLEGPDFVDVGWAGFEVMRAGPSLLRSIQGAGRDICCDTQVRLSTACSCSRSTLRRRCCRDLNAAADMRLPRTT